MKLSRALLSLFSALTVSGVASQGTDLGGSVVTRTDVEKFADLALDVRDIKQQLAAGESGAALSLYLNGRNAESSPGIKVTLKSLSDDMSALLDSTSRTPPTPAYLFHLFGLADRDVSRLSDHRLYAGNFVQTSLSSGSALSSDAIVALNMWMYATHLLYAGIDTCQRRTVADNPNAFTIGGGGMDEFIALWIGHDQRPGNDDGHSLYALAQKAAALFGQNKPEAPANSNLKLLYNDGASALSFPNACSRNNKETVPQLWVTAQRMLFQMNIPLMQMLIDAVVSRNTAATRLYAQALVPQIAQCRPSVYKRLKESLLDGTSVISRSEDVIRDLQSAYDCLGFTCSDIGAYRTDVLAQCADVPVNIPLAEYAPTTRVHSHSKIDLDVLQVKLLTSMGAFGFAKLLYRYGRNSALPQDSFSDPYRLRSLQVFATSSDRTAADPFYSNFASYHNDPNYANTLIMQTLDGLGKWGSASTAQKVQVVGDTCAFQVLYMQALTQLGAAMNGCNNQRLVSADGAHHWDEIAAYLIGSLEGPNAGGSVDLEDGQLVWSLANKRAFQFQTENKEGFSEVNVHLENLLFAGKAEMNAFDCVNLANTADRIQHLILLPMIQSTLRYAVINAELAPTSQSKDLAAGETFALSVLPIVQRYDESSAQVIEENMVFRSGVQPVQGGAQLVADAFYQALDEFGYSCTLVGATPQVDACRLGGGIAAVRGTSSAANVVRVVSTAIAAGLCTILML